MVRETPSMVHISPAEEKYKSKFLATSTNTETKFNLLLNEGLLRSSTGLFTQEECNNINFYLNNRDFTNGNDLRNRLCMALRIEA